MYIILIFRKDKMSVLYHYKKPNDLGYYEISNKFKGYLFI